MGTLVEINSAESTVSLQNVQSHGSEGRKNDPEEEVPASSQIYEFIVFRGSDVKDLRIEEAPAPPKENQPPMPNDPAIVGVSICPASLRPSPTSSTLISFVMNYFGCKTVLTELRKKLHVDTSVAFLLIKIASQCLFSHKIFTTASC